MKAIERAAFLAHARTKAFRRREDAALEFLRDVLSRYRAYVTFSGGKDSSVAWHLALRVKPNVPAAFFDSGGEHPLTPKFVRRFADQVGGRLEVFEPRLTYLDLLWLGYHGGTWISSETLMRFIIDEPAEAAAEMFDADAYIIGLRMDESHARKMTGLSHGPEHTMPGGMTRIAPLLKWSARDVWAYIVKYGLPYHPAYDERFEDEPIERRRVSVVVDVAAWTAPTTLARLRRWHPDVYHRLKAELPGVPWPE